MEYFKINYNKLENLQQIKYFKIILLIIVLFITIIILSLTIKIHRKFEAIGVIHDNLLLIKIDNRLSDKLNSSDYITFRDEKLNFEINKFGEYEIIDNVIFQEVELIIDKNFYDNEIGSIKFYYDKTSIFKYVLDLFNEGG